LKKKPQILKCDNCQFCLRHEEGGNKLDLWKDARERGWTVETWGTFCPVCSTGENAKRLASILRKPSDSIKRVKIDGYDI